MNQIAASLKRLALHSTVSAKNCKKVYNSAFKLHDLIEIKDNFFFKGNLESDADLDAAVHLLTL